MSNKITKFINSLPKVNHRKIIKIRAKKLLDGGYSLYLDIWHNQRREYRFLKLYLTGNAISDDENFRRAIALRDTLELELFQGAAGFQLKNWRLQSSFIEYFKAIADKKPATEAAWRNCLMHLQKFNPYVIFVDVDEKFCEGFKDYLIQRIARNTSHVYYSKIKAALNQAVRDGILQRNPANGIKIGFIDTERTFLNIEEIRLLAATPCANEQVKRAFLFSVFCGLRYSDILKMTWAEIEAGHLVFRQKKTNGFERIKLSEQAQLILNEQGRAQNGDKVFNLPCVSQIQKILRKWTAAAGIGKHITFHSGRHSFATLCLTHDIDIFTISKLLGHRELRTTQIYTKLIDKNKSAAIDRLPKI